MAMENVRLYTETQQVYLKLNQVQQESYQSQKLNAVGLLAGGMAHELNNQLSIIYACVDLSIHSLPQDGPLYRRIMKIQGAACKSANLTRQLLLFGNNQPQFKVSLDFNRDLLELKGLLERMIGKSCTLSFDLADDLRIIYADANNIEQVVINLVLNARDAMSTGGKITISTANVCIEDSSTDLQTGSNQQGSFVCLAVSDNGTGIDEENIQHLFEPFYTTKEPGDGTGLGLSVTYGIVQAHQGWIRVHSLSGEGSTFEVYLPAGEP
jgi:signal transduction histidine kinase